MPTYAKKLKDKDGNFILPVTRSAFVFADDNSTVEDILGPLIPPIESDANLNGNLQESSYIKSWYFDRSTNKWVLSDDSYVQIQDTTTVGLLINVDRNPVYNIKKLSITGYSRICTANPYLSVNLCECPSWPPADPDHLRSVMSLYDGSFPICDAASTTPIDVAVDTTGYTGVCIFIRARVDRDMVGGMEVQVSGDRFGALPILKGSELFSQVSTSETIDGKPNPFKGKTLEAILQDLNKKVWV